MPNSRETIVGIAWYRPQDWNRLREISVDPEAMEESHAKWLESTNRTLRVLQKKGHRVRRVIVNLDELLDFCRREKMQLDARARSQFVADRIRDEETGPRQ